MKSSFYTLLFVMLLGAAFSQKATASHIAGGEITYKCTSTPGVLEITFVFYRKCDGVEICTGGCGAACTRTLQIMGADPGCSGSSFGSVSLSLVSVRDINPEPQCPTAKSLCNNMGCTTPGTFSPGVERYEFKGLANIGAISGIPSSCCNLRFAYEECCRNASAIANSSGYYFYTHAIINRCFAMNPCNSSPEFTIDPIVAICNGEKFVYNNGAIDPDHDSLSYSFAPALQGFSSSIYYNPPFAYDRPMLWTGSATGTFPAGISCNPASGDIMFSAYTTSSDFTGIICIEVKEWRVINGIPTVIGITRRDIETTLLLNCNPNNTPRFTTVPYPGTNPNMPKTDWEICAGQQL